MKRRTRQTNQMTGGGANGRWSEHRHGRNDRRRGMRDGREFRVQPGCAKSRKPETYRTKVAEFPLREMLFILSECREPESKFRIKKENRFLQTKINQRSRISLARITCGRIDDTYRLMGFRGDVLFYKDGESRTIYAISYSRLIREKWFIKFQNSWSLIR